MKAIAVTPATKTVDIIDLPEPRISSPTDVKLRMLEAGVCGTDREICAFEYGTPPQGSPHPGPGSGLPSNARQSRRSRGRHGAPPVLSRSLHGLPLRPARFLLYRPIQ